MGTGHDVRDPDAADEQRDRPEAEQQRRERALRGGARLQRVGRPLTSTSSGFSAFAALAATSRTAGRRSAFARR
jgi:hypothetical protein